MTTPLRKRMIEDMQLHGLAPRTQEAYVRAVRDLAAYYNKSPDQISEEEPSILFVSEGRKATITKQLHYRIMWD